MSAQVQKVGTPTKQQRIDATRGPITRLAAQNPTTARTSSMDVTERRVEDPYEPGGKVAVAFNRRIDILEQDRRNLSVAAFDMGRAIQAVFERAARMNLPARSLMGGNRVDARDAHETAIGRAVEAAQAKRQVQDEVGRVHGVMGARFFFRVLLEAESYAAFAAQTIGAGDRKAGQVASRFRVMLEELTEARGAARAEGPAHGRIRAERDMPPMARGEVA